MLDLACEIARQWSIRNGSDTVTDPTTRGKRAMSCPGSKSLSKQFRLSSEEAR